MNWPILQHIWEKEVPKLTILYRRKLVTICTWVWSMLFLKYLWEIITTIHVNRLLISNCSSNKSIITSKYPYKYLACSYVLKLQLMSCQYKMIDQTLIKRIKDWVIFSQQYYGSETLVFLHNFCDHLFKIGFNLKNKQK